MINVKLTKYFVLSQSDYGSNNIIPVKDQNNNTITLMDPVCFADGACEGTIRLNDGRLTNVTGKWMPIDPQSAMALKQVADERYKGRYNYVGLANDFKSYLAFDISNTQWGVGAFHGEPLTPFFTCAVDPNVFPLGSTLYMPILNGMRLPNNIIHSGYLWAIDTGGGIKGNHIDMMSGTKAWANQWKLPDSTDVEVYSTAELNWVHTTQSATSNK